MTFLGSMIQIHKTWHLHEVGMEGEDAEHDLVCPQGPQQLYPLNDSQAAILNIAQALAAHTDALLFSILSTSVEYPEIV